MSLRICIFYILPFLSGFVHLLTSLTESLLNCLRGSIVATIWSIVRGVLGEVEDEVDTKVDDWKAAGFVDDFFFDRRRVGDLELVFTKVAELCFPV